MNRKAVAYLRFSSEEQSSHSIERQQMITGSWMQHFNVELVDSFEDQGYTATNFDRPDFKKLYAFIGKNYRNIDYVVVSDLTRFSRELGDAINIVKKIQKEYGIKIVSASRGAIYDVTEPNSFFMMALEFLLGNTENIKRANDINSSIYAAKAVKGRYIGPRAPFGYKKEHWYEGKKKLFRLIIVEEEATIVRWIYNAYLRNCPLYLIKDDAKAMGLRGTKHTLVESILACPVYAGMQYVKPYKDQPGGIYPLADHVPIIDLVTWNQVQEKMNKKLKPRTVISEDVPLRGAIYCHCGTPLTGAASRGKSGKYFYYYKCCKTSKHNNISAVNAHEQLKQAFDYMSLTPEMVRSLTLKSEFLLESRMKDRTRLIDKRSGELDQVETDLRSLEKKWIADQINFETYNRWNGDYTKQRNYLRAQIDQLKKEDNNTHTLLLQTVNWLTDMRHVFDTCNAVQKQELVRTVFDNSLYYENKVYRTPYMIPELSHNELIMKEKNLLIWEKKRGNFAISPSGGGEGIRTPVQT
jgi:site-specific DNA recombinase